MTAYNGEQYVGAQIESILASSYQDFELFIYDDGSKDNTMEILKGYEREYPSKVHVFRNETNLGVTLNFLKAFARTTMDYVMFCDQDDVWKSNKIAITLKRMRHMEAQTGKEVPLAVFTDASTVDKDLKEIHGSFFCSNHLDPGKTDLAHLLMENKLIGCTVMVNAALRKVLQSNHYPEKARFHDWWVALIAASFGRISYVNERTLLYRQHGNNIVGGSGFFDYMKNRLATLHQQRESIKLLEVQAEEFLALYGEKLSADRREVIETFSMLHQTGCIKRRCLLIKYGYLKTGLVRNIGLLIII
jgi:glycosyltransferase involved in cell wall biosynthesis